jgi:hypothetical protein
MLRTRLSKQVKAHWSGDSLVESRMNLIAAIALGGFTMFALDAAEARRPKILLATTCDRGDHAIPTNAISHEANGKRKSKAARLTRARQDALDGNGNSAQRWYVERSVNGRRHAERTGSSACRPKR